MVADKNATALESDGQRIKLFMPTFLSSLTYFCISSIAMRLTALKSSLPCLALLQCPEFIVDINGNIEKIKLAHQS